MRIVVSGASGLIGAAVVSHLQGQGHDVVRLVRSAARNSSQIEWDPSGDKLDSQALAGTGALIHLSGEPVMGIRWTPAKKRAIRESRVKSTSLLCNRIAELDPPPQVWLCASAIGYYGSRGDEPLDEESPPGPGFLGSVCQEWEAATFPAQECGIRVVNLRFGVVLSPKGGALAAMVKPFKLGMGGIIGDGGQYVSWIALDDAVSAICHALTTPALAGPVNLVAPQPVTNRELTRALGRVLGRPAVVPLPAFAVRLLLGEMGEEMLLASTRAYPRKLVASGFAFTYPELEPALRSLIGKR